MTIKKLAPSYFYIFHSKDFDDFSLVNCLDMSNDYKTIIWIIIFLCQVECVKHFLLDFQKKNYMLNILLNPRTDDLIHDDSSWIEKDIDHIKFNSAN